MGQLSFTTEKIDKILNVVAENSKEVTANNETNLEFNNLFKIMGKINLTNKDEIKNAQLSLTDTNSVGIYLITDSSGKIPSSEEQGVTLTSDILKQLTLQSPNAGTNAALNLVTSSVTLDPIGVNVGDIIAITRVNVAVADLASALGIGIGLAGDIELYQYKIWSTNDAKAPNYANTNGKPIANGVSGLMSPWDKMQVNKIPNIETLSNNALAKADVLPTYNVWDSNMDECLNQGIYPWCLTGRPVGSAEGTHYTLVVMRSSTADNSGYYTITQTCYGREGADYGKIFQRIIFQQPNGTTDWGKGWLRLDADERIPTLQQRITGLEQGMSPFYYPFVSLGHIGGDGSSATQDLLNQVLDDLVDATKTPDRGGVFRALYNGSQIIIEQYAASYALNKFTQVVRGQIIIDSTDDTKIKWEYADFRILVRDYNISVGDGWSKWRDVSPRKIASLEARIKALESK